MKCINYRRLVIMIMAVVLISTAIISIYSNKIFAPVSEVVTKSELHSGYSPTLFEPCYKRPDSVCNYSTGLLETDNTKGTLVTGPNVTLDAGKYVLILAYELLNPAELKDTEIYCSVDIYGSNAIEIERGEWDLLNLSGKELCDFNGEIRIPFQINQRTDNINWTLQYQNAIKMGVRSIILEEQK